MQLIIDRDVRRHARSGETLLLQAKDGARRCYLVAIAIVEWEALRRRHGEGAVAELEFLSLEGRWETHEGRKVRRIGRSPMFTAA